jgi:peptidoglycan DL-endopeptidase CwlO
VPISPGFAEDVHLGFDEVPFDGHTTMRRLAFVCSLLAAVATTAVTASPANSQSAAAARSQLERASERLSRTTEAYNDAKLKRAGLDAKLTEARGDQARSEQHLGAVRERLGKAVRDMYMHPAAGLDTFFQAKSFGELSRGRAMAGQVALSADSLLLQIRKAKAENQAATKSLQALRDQARSEELDINEQRRAASAALDSTQRLLAQANASDLDAARRARLGAAGDLASNIHSAGPVRKGAGGAVAAAASQIGKPYRWGGAGPDSYDCSGLTMWAWARAGVSLPHSSKAQYASLPHVSLSQLAPGDLIFYGRPIHHVGIYKGGGVMIAAPRSGQTVREESIYYSRPVGAARP